MTIMYGKLTSGVDLIRQPFMRKTGFMSEFGTPVKKPEIIKVQSESGLHFVRSAREPGKEISL